MKPIDPRAAMHEGVEEALARSGEGVIRSKILAVRARYEGKTLEKARELAREDIERILMSRTNPRAVAELVAGVLAAEPLFDGIPAVSSTPPGRWVTTKKGK